MAADSHNRDTVWTILMILDWVTEFFDKKGLDNARLEAQHLLAAVLGLSRIQLYTQYDRPLIPAERATVREAVKRRAQHEPLQYIVGRCDFHDIELRCDERALIPRPETERLVEFALARLGSDEDVTLIDVGTGSGAVALAIAAQRPLAHVAALDISSEALALARENAADLAEAHQLRGRLSLMQNDLLEGLDARWQEADMVVSNPPYIGESEREMLDADVVDWEPEQALFAGDDGLAIIRRLVPQAYAQLRAGGHLLCEIGYLQGEAVSAMYRDTGFEGVEVLQDLDDRDRVVVGRKPA